jgi:hypothetical protein
MVEIERDSQLIIEGRGARAPYAVIHSFDLV